MNRTPTRSFLTILNPDSHRRNTQRVQATCPTRAAQQVMEAEGDVVLVVEEVYPITHRFEAVQAPPPPPPPPLLLARRVY